MSRRQLQLYRAPNLLALLLLGALLTGCNGSIRNERTSSGTIDSTSSTTLVPAQAHFGDGVCADSFASYAVTLAQAPTDASTRLSASQAIAVTRSTNSLLPTTATFSAYAALVTSNNLTLPDQSTALGNGHVTNRLMWIVEVGNVTYELPGGKYDPNGGSSSTTLRVFHHLVDVVDDSSSVELLTFDCS